MNTVLVTGGSRGIGRAIVELFTDSGFSVYAPPRAELDLATTVNLQERKFSVVINCAGINPVAGILDADHQTVMQVNYFSPLQILQQCLPHMVSSNYGRIVNIGSIWVQNAKQGRSAYGAAKNALHALTKSISAEYGKYNVLANTISPGFVGTDLTFRNNTVEQLDQIIQDIPTGRLAHPKEIAKLVYQMTVENSYVTGQNIVIDGGFSCTRF